MSLRWLPRACWAAEILALGFLAVCVAAGYRPVQIAYAAAPAAACQPAHNTGGNR